MPPPGMPMLPNSSCTMAPVRIICEPTECWVQPRAYMMVMTRVGSDVSATRPQTCSSSAFGVPQMLLTRSAV
ncbi:hypothetical protein D3C72_1800280 [compost metagenome]